MLKIQAFALDTLKTMAPMVAAIAGKDPDLGRQLGRSATSIVLNIAEAQVRPDGNARLRFRTALGSARETHAALDVGIAWGYVKPDAAVLDALDRIQATLNKLSRWHNGAARALAPPAPLRPARASAHATSAAALPRFASRVSHSAFVLSPRSRPPPPRHPGPGLLFVPLALRTGTG